ncbi:MAG: ribonuclease P protein component [Bacteroidia bacterium]|nr:ribonuclease P protein component [Bacteroidia bacterium]
MAGDPSDPQRFAFRKTERLRHRRTFEHLFQHVSSFRVDVLTFLYAFDLPAGLVTDPLMAAMVAPKRQFRRANRRNLLRRRMKEAWRLHKHSLRSELALHGRSLAVLVKYNARYESEYAAIEAAMRHGMHRLARHARKPAPPPAPAAGPA